MWRFQLSNDFRESSMVTRWRDQKPLGGSLGQESAFSFTSLTCQWIRLEFDGICHSPSPLSLSPPTLACKWNCFQVGKMYLSIGLPPAWMWLSVFQNGAPDEDDSAWDLIGWSLPSDLHWQWSGPVEMLQSSRRNFTYHITSSRSRSDISSSPCKLLHSIYFRWICVAVTAATGNNTWILATIAFSGRSAESHGVSWLFLLYLFLYVALAITCNWSKMFLDSSRSCLSAHQKDYSSRHQTFQYHSFTRGSRQIVQFWCFWRLPVVYFKV